MPHCGRYDIVFAGSVSRTLYTVCNIFRLRCLIRMSLLVLTTQRACLYTPCYDIVRFDPLVMYNYMIQSLSASHIRYTLSAAFNRHSRVAPRRRRRRVAIGSRAPAKRSSSLRASRNCTFRKTSWHRFSSTLREAAWRALGGGLKSILIV